MATRWDIIIIKIYDENIFFHISPNIRDIITIFGRLALFLQNCVQFYDRLHKSLRFSCIEWYLLFWILFTRKQGKSPTNLHSASIFVRFIGIWMFVPHNPLSMFITFNFKLWNTAIPWMIEIEKRHHFHHSSAKRLLVTIAGIWQNTTQRLYFHHARYKFILVNAQFVVEYLEGSLIGSGAISVNKITAPNMGECITWTD